MPFWKMLILALVQGFVEILPVSSSAHVVVAEKLMGLDPSAPAMTLLLVMLHTGTMFAVIVYFWQQWRRTFFRDSETFKRFAGLAVLATVLTGAVGFVLQKVVEKTLLRGVAHAQIEDAFGHLEWIWPALAAGGLLILIAGFTQASGEDTSWRAERERMNSSHASLIGIVQGICLPFRGFSRSGATISTGLLAGLTRPTSEAFSFALAVILTPAVVGREVLRLHHAQPASGAGLASAILPSAIGMVLSFLAGLAALQWLSRWLEHGRWWLFGVYCLVASGVVFYLHHAGY